jgi:thymidylate synthase (FAD)
MQPVKELGFIEVLDKGFVKLENQAGTDLEVINAARVSFGRRKENMGPDDCRLITFLIENKHGTPFEHAWFQFHIKCPIFVAREWMRHRMASYNELSGRYSKLNPEFYVPKLEDFRKQKGKPGDYSFDPVEHDLAYDMRHLMLCQYEETYELYEKMLEKGIAKEVARMVLPVSTYTEFYFSINARSLMNFLMLRNEDHALHEIREYARVIEKIFAQRMPHTHAAFLENGRVAP